jgi:Fur family ferric uptake transcriptional regulator
MTEWEKRLADAGYRITASRRAVMQVLMQADVPLSPQEILEQAQTVHRGLGLVTVYRAVTLLQELNLVCRVHCSNGCHGYVATSPGHRHHIICRQCGRTVEFPGSEDLNALIAQVEQNTDYLVDGHLLQLFGLCPDCRRTEG